MHKHKSQAYITAIPHSEQYSPKVEKKQNTLFQRLANNFPGGKAEPNPMQAGTDNPKRIPNETPPSRPRNRRPLLPLYRTRYALNTPFSPPNIRALDTPWCEKSSVSLTCSWSSERARERRKWGRKWQLLSSSCSSIDGSPDTPTLLSLNFRPFSTPVYFPGAFYLPPTSPSTFLTQAPTRKFPDILTFPLKNEIIKGNPNNNGKSISVTSAHSQSFTRPELSILGFLRVFRVLLNAAVHFIGFLHRKAGGWPVADAFLSFLIIGECGGLFGFGIKSLIGNSFSLLGGSFSSIWLSDVWFSTLFKLIKIVFYEI